MGKKWSELPRWQRTATAVLAPVEVVLTVVAAIDLARRPEREVRGPKAVWWPLLFVQPVGPAAYLGWGRRRPGN
ncbi:PLDc N-terminal domain-containing protein [Micromonospora sp. HK10]|uniref:PLDc N-terminal domain-containing protein n=1 Tax=Micromonospora sp. HK10 TaxID=1538294 RepID=UPI0006272CE3|nr:PLDc N-terminal domain-containing protein [Micromonospora sp. HK10]KKK01514.1 membrane protein [Micromonospora sp. HK10]